MARAPPEGAGVIDVSSNSGRTARAVDDCVQAKPVSTSIAAAVSHEYDFCGSTTFPPFVT